MNTASTLGTADRIILQLELTKKEIEQFLYDLTQESTDAVARYETLKGELKTSVREMREMLDSKNLLTEKEAALLLAKLSLIDEHLRKPNRNAVDHIKQFLSSIKGALKQVSDALSKEGSVNEFLENVHDRLQRYRLKFEILKLRLALGKLKLTYAGEEMEHLLTQKIDALSKFIGESQHETSETLSKVRNTVKKIYTDIAKVFS